MMRASANTTETKGKNCQCGVPESERLQIQMQEESQWVPSNWLELVIQRQRKPPSLKGQNKNWGQQKCQVKWRQEEYQMISILMCIYYNNISGISIYASIKPMPLNFMHI